MRTIYKYPVPVPDEFVMDIPKGALLLDVQIQRGEPQLWAMLDNSNETESRRFRVIGTGHSIRDERPLSYVGTFQIHGGELAFHLFEVVQ